VTYNSTEVIEGCLNSLASRYHPGYTLEIIIADNASSDDTLDLVRSILPEATVVAGTVNAGYSAGINAGVRAAGAHDAVLILNDDIRVAPGSINAMARAFEHPDTGIAVPKLIDSEGNLLESLRRSPSVLRIWGEALIGGDRSGRVSWLGEVVVDRDAYDNERVVAWASGCAWLISAQCWSSVGPWDESFFLYAEDTEYAQRARDAGFQMRFVPDAEVVHLVGPSHEQPTLWTMSVWNRYRLFRRRHGRLASGLFRLGLIVNEGTRALLGRKVHRTSFVALVNPKRLPDQMR
jgi:GT2 family glycosyltransferase